MSEEAIKNREIINNIRVALCTGKISYDQAREYAKPIIEKINAKSVEIAKKYNTKPQLVSFEALMR